MSVDSARRKVLGVGLAQQAHSELAALSRDYEVHMIKRGPRDQVKTDIERLCATQGPFQAAFILFANGSYAPIDEDLLRPLWQNDNSVRVFAQCGTGYDNVQTEVFDKYDCYFTNTPDAVTSATADFTVFLLLAVFRATTYCEEFAKTGKWHDGLELSTDPAGKVLGVFGMGRIGKDFARKIQPFGFRVLYNTRTRLDEATEQQLGLEYSTKEDLLRRSDAICCLIPGTQDTYHLLDEKEFDLMKEGVLFVNSSRGMVVNEIALKSALQSGKVKRAGLDVFENEPRIDEFFLASPNVTCTPHVAAYTTGTIYRGERDAFENVRRFLETGYPVSPINGPFRQPLQKPQQCLNI